MEIDRRNKPTFCAGRGGGDCCQVPEAGFPRVSPLWSAVQGAALFSLTPHQEFSHILTFHHLNFSQFKRTIKD